MSRAASVHFSEAVCSRRLSDADAAGWGQLGVMAGRLASIAGSSVTAAGGMSTYQSDDPRGGAESATVRQTRLSGRSSYHRPGLLSERRQGCPLAEIRTLLMEHAAAEANQARRSLTADGSVESGRRHLLESAQP